MNGGVVLLKSDIESLKRDLRDIFLSGEENEARYSHSVSTMTTAKRLAEEYGEDPKRAAKTALMHDMVKKLNVEEFRRYINHSNINVPEDEMEAGVTLHGIVAADLCKKLYGFDEEMCSAIANHTMGKENMTMLEKIVFIADKIEPTRDYPEVDTLGVLAYTDIDEAIIQSINNTIKYNMSMRRVILEGSIRARNYIVKNHDFLL